MTNRCERISSIIKDLLTCMVDPKKKLSPIAAELTVLAMSTEESALINRSASLDQLKQLLNPPKGDNQNDGNN